MDAFEAAKVVFYTRLDSAPILSLGQIGAFWLLLFLLCLDQCLPLFPDGEMASGSVPIDSGRPYSRVSRLESSGVSPRARRNFEKQEVPTLFVKMTVHKAGVRQLSACIDRFYYRSLIHLSICLTNYLVASQYDKG